MSKLTEAFDVDECIAQAMKKTPNLSTDQLLSLAQVIAAEKVAEEARTLNLLTYQATLAKAIAGDWLPGEATLQMFDRLRATIVDRLDLS